MLDNLANRVSDTMKLFIPNISTVSEGSRYLMGLGSRFVRERVVLSHCMEGGRVRVVFPVSRFPFSLRETN